MCHGHFISVATGIFKILDRHVGNTKTVLGVQRHQFSLKTGMLLFSFQCGGNIERCRIQNHHATFWQQHHIDYVRNDFTLKLTCWFLAVVINSIWWRGYLSYRKQVNFKFWSDIYDKKLRVNWTLRDGL